MVDSSQTSDQDSEKNQLELKLYGYYKENIEAVLPPEPVDGSFKPGWCVCIEVNGKAITSSVMEGFEEYVPAFFCSNVISNAGSGVRLREPLFIYFVPGDEIAIRSPGQKHAPLKIKVVRLEYINGKPCKKANYTYHDVFLQTLRESIGISKAAAFMYGAYDFELYNLDDSGKSELRDSGSYDFDQSATTG